MSYNLYCDHMSPYCRSVLMVGRELGIQFNLHLLNLLSMDHMRPEFLAINPHHKIPTLVDNVDDGFAVWESRSIMTYLVDKVAPGHSLYPADLKTRAKINSWLDYDAGSLCPILSSIQYGKYYYDKPVTPEDVVLLKRELQKLDSALMGRKYVVGEHRSVADLTLLSVVTTLSFLEEVDISEFHNIIRWKKGLRDELPYYDEINDVDRIMKMWKDVSGGKQVY